MKTISYWAKRHVWQSRSIIILIYISLNFIGIFVGKLLHAIHVTLPFTFFISCILCTILLWIFYPSANNKKQIVSPRKSYCKRKVFDFSLGAVTFLMIIYTGNNWNNINISNEVTYASNIIDITKDSALHNNPHIKNFISIINSKDVSKLSKHEKLRLLKNQIKEIKHDKGTSSTEKTLLIILSILVALLLLGLLAGLACNLSCSGSEALAAVVGIGGTVLIIFLLVLFIKRITKKPVIK